MIMILRNYTVKTVHMYTVHVSYSTQTTTCMFRGGGTGPADPAAGRTNVGGLAGKKIN